MTNTAAPLIVAVNAGSSSLKVAAYGEATDAPAFSRGVQAGTGAPWLIAWLTKTVGRKSVCLIGHRIVASRPGPPIEEVTPSLLAALHKAASDDPIHLPAQLALIEAVAAALPRARQFVCSDSAFHSTIPPAGRHLPLPRRFDDVGIERIGFHGLSCASVVAQLWKTIGYKATAGRLIIAHLGSGASVTAVLNCESRDTSMGFSPDGGLMMASRPGDLDPGVLLAILRRGQHSTEQLSHLIASESGLLGRAGDTGDLRVLLAREATDPVAAEAIEMFCRSAARAIAGAATTIGGIDILVFTGGVGEHLPEIRARICAALAFLPPMTVLVIAADEEQVIATLVRQHCNATP